MVPIFYLLFLDPRFTSEVIDQMKGVNYPDELIKLVESQYLRYGDTIKLQTKSHYTSATSSSSYLGVYKKPSGTARICVPPCGSLAPGKFEEHIYQILDPYDSEKDDFLLYGDIVVLKDNNDLVWNCKNKKGSLDGYLLPQKRGQPGEIFVSFCKTGKQGEPIVYGEPGVFIQVEESNRFRNSFAGNKLTNFKYSKSKVQGGYLACHGGGHVLNFFIHPETGTPDGSYVVGTTNLLLRNSSQTSKLLNFLNNSNVDSSSSSGPQEPMDLKQLENKTKSQAIKLPIDTLNEIQSIFKTKSDILNSTELKDLFVFQLFSLFFLFVINYWIFPKYFETHGIESIINMKNICLLNIISYALGLYTPNKLMKTIFHLQDMRLSVKQGQARDKEENSDGFVVIDRSSSSTSEGSLSSKSDKSQNKQIAVEVATKSLDGSAEIDSKLEIIYRKWRSFGTDKDGVPVHPAFMRFLDGEFGKMEVAKKRWEVTCDWRESNDIDTVLKRPNILFEAIKKSYPHYLLGVSKKGYAVYVEEPGCLKTKQLYQAGVSVEDMLFHNIYISEFIWSLLICDSSVNSAEEEALEEMKQKRKQERAKSRLMTIIDMKGIKLKDVFGDAITVLKSSASISEAHYPERSYKIFVLNIPRWFNVIFKIVKPFIAEETLKKVRIYRHGFEEELLSEIDADILPKKYGGNLESLPYESELEKKLWSFVYLTNVKNGVFLTDDKGKQDKTSIDRMTAYVQKLGDVKFRLKE